MAKRVLIVEDDRSSRAALAELLQEEGFEPVQADSAAAAIEACRAATPDLVLLDYRLPDGNGVELLEQLRADEAVHCPVILVSGSSDLAIADDGEPSFLDHAEAALSAGAAGYIAKPIDLPSLLEAMTRALESGAQRSD